ncbi:MAG: hypothetical protein H6907_17145 [Hyphomicrobiales bacterium]|nr:hypothetical protein [Hyphomicrobiales bacterium]
MSAPPVHRFREADAGLLPRFVERGYSLRHLFPHRVTFLNKCGPDAVKLARAMVGPCAPGDLWLALLHAGDGAARDLPPDLFFDDRVVWHRQQLGLPGHVAFATFVVRDGVLHGLNYVSDLVQRQALAGPHRTRINAAFRGWPYLLLNALVSFAAERGLTEVRSPAAELVVAHGDPSRQVQAALFDRIYDAAVARLFDARRDGRWWRIDLAGNRGRVVPLPANGAPLPAAERTVCILHDVEAGLGHPEDAELSARADAAWRAAVAAMADGERRHGIAATYSVVGQILPETLPLIGAGACVAFHSADHAIGGGGGGRMPSFVNRLRAVRSLRKVRANLAERRAGLYSAELDGCRRIDYRPRGYRPAQSRLRRDLTTGRLVHYNFDWLASSRGSLGIDAPVLDGPLARIPVLFDDYDLYRAAMPYDQWEQTALRRVAESRFVTFGLHDCYGEYWLPHYDGLLSRLAGMGRLTTLDQVANELFLAAAA